MTKEEELVKGLTELVQDRIAKGWWRMGIRTETEELSHADRSKAVRAYIVDLFGNYSDVEGLHELEDTIGESIEMYYDKLDEMKRKHIEKHGEL